VEPLLLLGVIVALALVWAWLKSRLGEAANRSVFSRRAHKLGQELTGSILRVTATGTSAAVHQSLESTVETVGSAPTILADVYIESNTPERIQYACGNRMTTAFRAVVTLQTDGDKVIVEQAFSQWRTADGVVSPVSTMQRLRSDVEAGVRAIDPAAAVTIVERRSPRHRARGAAKRAHGIN
jgi:hypothetical protein